MILFIIGVILFIAGIFIFFAGFDEFTPGMSLIGMALAAISVVLMIYAGSTLQKQHKATVTENVTDTNVNSNVDDDLKNKDALSDTVDKDQYYGKFPRDFTNDEPGKAKWWHDWAVYNTDGDPIICRDGVQVIVSGSANNGGGIVSISVRTRVHQDGKPYTCDETKDPAEEVHS